MDVPTTADVLASINAFLARHDMKQTRFGAEAVADPNLVKSLEDGASPRLERLHRIREYMQRKDVEVFGEGHVASAPATAGASSGKPPEISGGVAA